MANLLRICVDPGHGGRDSGALSSFFPELKESEINLKIANEVAMALALKGHKVEMTRKKDVFVSLKNRVDCAHNMNADLFLSIHCNGFRDSVAHGLETLINSRHGDRTARFASSIHASITCEFPGRKNRGIKKRNNLYVLKKTRCSAVLLECGFITNEEGGLFLSSTATHKRFAEAICRGLESEVAHGN